MPSQATADTWRSDLGLLDDVHARLVRAARAALPKVDAEAETGRRLLRLIRGIACYDVYHAGQVRLLIRLSGAKRSER